MSGSDVTSALEVAGAVLFMGGLLAGLVLGFVAGRHGRRPARLDVHVDQALALANDRGAERLAAAVVEVDPDGDRRLDPDTPTVPLDDREWDASEQLLGSLDTVGLRWRTRRLLRAKRRGAA